MTWQPDDEDDTVDATYESDEEDWNKLDEAPSIEDADEDDLEDDTDDSGEPDEGLFEDDDDDDE